MCDDLPSPEELYEEEARRLQEEKDAVSFFGFFFSTLTNHFYFCYHFIAVLAGSSRKVAPVVKCHLQCMWF